MADSYYIGTWDFRLEMWPIRDISRGDKLIAMVPDKKEADSLLLLLLDRHKSIIERGYNFGCILN
jgi:hypothetical protein